LSKLEPRSGEENCSRGRKPSVSIDLQQEPRSGDRAVRLLLHTPQDSVAASAAFLTEHATEG